jgi:dephospho-CoA kinase
MPRRNIALSARSGGGKSLAAAYLHSRYAYTICAPGAICREITRRLFDSESKTMLNRVNDAMRGIDPDVWLRVALKELQPITPGRLICIDGMRFKSNLAYCRSHGFQLVKITASEQTRARRLAARMQVFDPAVDEMHAAETEIEDEAFDYIIANEEDNPETLYRELDLLVTSS